MVTVRSLLNASRPTKIGNHHVQTKIFGGGRRFFYYSTEICSVDDVNKTFWVDNGGWGTSSTTRAINAYKRELVYLGYKQVEKAGA